MNALTRFLFFLTILGIQQSFCQNRLPSYWFTSDNGELPQNSIKSIAPDKDGFIWMTTEDGLVRFDGQQFKVYNSDNITGLRSNRMMFLKKSRFSDGLCVNTDVGQTVHVNQVPEVLPQKTKDRNENQELGYLFSNNVDIYTSYFKNSPTYNILLKNYYYSVTRDSIRLYNLKHKRLGAFSNRFVNGTKFFVIDDKLFLKNKKDYFIVSPTRLVKINFNMPTSGDETIYANNAIDQAFMYQNGKLYYLTAGKNGITPKLILSDFNTVKNNVSTLYYDPKLGIVYIGSLTKGFMIVRPQNFKSYTDIQDPVVYSSFAYDSVSVVTGKGQIISSNGTIRHLKTVLKTDKFFSILDNNGDLWTINYENSFHRYKKSSNYSLSDDWSLKFTPSLLYKDDKGLMWIGASNYKKYDEGKLYYIDPDDAAKKLNWAADFNFLPNSAQKIGAHKFVIGSQNGLYTVDLKQKSIVKNQLIGNAYIRGIQSSRANEIWVNTYNNGFFLIRNNVTTHFPFDRNKYIRSAHCIVEDAKGYMWITTNKGLFQVAKSSLIAYADKKKSTIYYHYYDKASGFKSNEFNGGCSPCATKLANHYIALPSFEGMVFFDSQSVRPILPTNPIYINEARIDNKLVTFKDTIVINRNFSRVTFFLNSPFYGNPENLNIEVKLDNADNQYWTKTNDNYTISYTSLYPGEYKLTARKLNGFDSEYQYKTITIIIPPAYWQTIWFKILVLITFLLLLYFGFRQRTKYIRHRNLLLEKKIIYHTTELKNTINVLTKTKADLSEQIHSHKKLIGSITHDIKSPLKYMALTGKYLYENLDRDNPDFQENIKTMYTSSFELFHFVNNLLEYSKTYLNKNDIHTERFSLHQLINEKIKLFEPIAKSRKTVLENNVSELLHLTLNKQLFTIIIHNLLDNAVKNTEAGTITFSGYKTLDTIGIILTDTGIGMNPELVAYYQTLSQRIKSEHYEKQFTKGIGFTIIIELLNLLNGDIKIESEENKGTVITLLFKR